LRLPQILFVLAVALAAVLPSEGGSGTDSVLASHAGGMDAMSIDVDPQGVPANTATSLGTRETTAYMNENNLLDGDEDMIDAMIIDITAQGIPQSTPMNEFNFVLVIGPSSDPGVCVVANDPMFLLWDATAIDVSEDRPDCDGAWGGHVVSVGGVAHGTGVRGSGVLQRVTIETQPNREIDSLIGLQLDTALHSGPVPGVYEPDVLRGAAICINDCEQPDPPPVGGIAGLIDGTSEAPASEADGGTSGTLLAAGLAAAAIPALAAGAWLARLAFVRRRAR
jgi:hypothetical protein